jgi:hypothetical protein
MIYPLILTACEALQVGGYFDVAADCVGAVVDFELVGLRFRRL